MIPDDPYPDPSMDAVGCCNPRKSGPPRGFGWCFFVIFECACDGFVFFVLCFIAFKAIRATFMAFLRSKLIYVCFWRAVSELRSMEYQLSGTCETEELESIYISLKS